ncbi:competence type IV pilus minor pilin ComGD [Cytobacillus sp. NCCP-133]|uniref:competence type IV pilus minor pilin ComGD n=1 Tax=Cytobacillus sp. NCCP-133 TaxID=766848 RepID=UPI002230FDDE|nr:competence type IV pilus minor pilin ComGD [Cytobacillus sp. NCCP-133]GLB58178.1 competence protein ComG [Cytobacillus sp. NCCP-133]
MIKNQKGFTLLESLFVLSIFLIIATITAVLIKPHFIYFEKQMFFTQLKADLLFAQQYAITHQTEVIVQFAPDQQMYSAHTKIGSRPVVIREYSKIFEVKKGTMPLYFQYGPGGNTNKFGSFYISAGEERYQITFLIGQGRFYVAKE